MLTNIIVYSIMAAIFIYFVFLIFKSKSMYQLEQFNARAESAKKIYYIFYNYFDGNLSNFNKFINCHNDKIYIDNDSISFEFNFYTIKLSFISSQYELFNQLEDIFEDCIFYGNKLNDKQLSINNNRSKLDEINKLSENIKEKYEKIPLTIGKY